MSEISLSSSTSVFHPHTKACITFHSFREIFPPKNSLKLVTVITQDIITQYVQILLDILHFNRRERRAFDVIDFSYRKHFSRGNVPDVAQSHGNKQT